MFWTVILTGFQQTMGLSSFMPIFTGNASLYYRVPTHF